jgi:glycerol-3-phosphate O-acyltransferase
VVQEEQRRFVQKLGFRILHEVNEASVMGATSLSATVLLASPRGTCAFDEFATSARALAELLRWRGTTFTPSLERNLGQANFGEITSFLASSGLLAVTDDGGARSLTVPANKRKVLDFYKNNTIHFFLLPALLAHAYLRSVPRSELKEELWWWLNLLRWEFALPERESVAAEAGRLLDYFRAHGASFDAERRPVLLVGALVGILENFREAYWIAARTALQLDGEPRTEAHVIAQMSKHFEAALLLGEVRKPEAATSVTFGNAISRLVEVGCLERETRKGERDRWLRRGPQFRDLEAIAARVGASLTGGGLGAR